jgi:uncharacterized membrane-anchored protein
VNVTVRSMIPGRHLSAPVGAIAAGAVCLAILAGMMVRHAWPLWTGTTVVLRAVPVDPRDLFRGEFVRLSTPANRLFVTADPVKPAEAPDAVVVRPGDDWWERWPAAARRESVGAVVYVQLEPDPASGEHRPVTVSRGKVPGALNLQGRVVESYPPYIQVDYGLEAFFMAEGTARPVEDAIRNGQRVQMDVAVAAGGRARVRNLIIDGTPLPRR